MKSSKEEVQNRRDKVLDYIVSKETTSIDELSMYFSVSSITIRRDIEELQQRHGRHAKRHRHHQSALQKTSEG